MMYDKVYYNGKYEYGRRNISYLLKRCFVVGTAYTIRERGKSYFKFVNYTYQYPIKCFYSEFKYIIRDKYNLK